MVIQISYQLGALIVKNNKQFVPLHAEFLNLICPLRTLSLSTPRDRHSYPEEWTRTQRWYQESHSIIIYSWYHMYLPTFDVTLATYIIFRYELLTYYIRPDAFGSVPNKTHYSHIIDSFRCLTTNLPSVTRVSQNEKDYQAPFAKYVDKHLSSCISSHSSLLYPLHFTQSVHSLAREISTHIAVRQRQITHEDMQEPIVSSSVWLELCLVY